MRRRGRGTGFWLHICVALSLVLLPCSSFSSGSWCRRSMSGSWLAVSSITSSSSPWPHLGPATVPLLSSTALGLTSSSSRSEPIATALGASHDNSSASQGSANPHQNHQSNHPTMLKPRPRAIVYMGLAMALHFGGYEFFRNSCLALFTSADYGFNNNKSAFPLASGLVSPFSVLMLWLYGRQLDAVGPRQTLFRTTAFSIAFILTSSALLTVLHRSTHIPHVCCQAVMGLTFLYQSSYQYLLYTQHWSFVSSVLTPDEGSKWIPILTGVSSLLCSCLGALVPVLSPRTGLVGLMACTAVTLSGTLILADQAYRLSADHGFDPTRQKQQKSSNKNKSAVVDTDNKFRHAAQLFRRVPTLAALLMETVSFQSLCTILNIAFVTELNRQIPTDDLARSTYTSRTFVWINTASAFLQLIVAPVVVSRTEPRFLWKVVPTVPLALLAYGVWQASSSSLVTTISMPLLTFTWATTKVLDYAIRSVLTILVYQPLDYESRYVGKEVIGVLGSRLGKSGVAIVLAALANSAAGSSMGWMISGSVAWWTSAVWLSRMVKPKQEAQRIVEERQAGEKKDKAS